ncbi:anti-sigma regulatory factor [Emticicia agri]|uniref:Anti-sigma regulatory factor n=1 Tax=Emticicia agri TaxID=2492393 RepID=A0A4Q5LV28_9BACT|nr:anti-sigma regulatory factor [Emticicia agri]RYU93395.1 anti-sigma regulatory factor [Emticicia agri]
MIVTLSKDSIRIAREQDTIFLRNRVKEWATKIGMGLVNQTKLITAASELVRNMLKYAGGGTVDIEIVSKGRENGVKLVFRDKGPGIKDINLAMRDGYTTGKSLGLGLPGTRRLVSEFDIQSVVDEGTTISIIKWKNG